MEKCSERAGRPGKGVDEKSMAWGVAWRDWGQAAVMFVRFFSRLATVASRGKSDQGENGGRPGKDLVEKSMAWRCEPWKK